MRPISTEVYTYTTYDKRASSDLNSSFEAERKKGKDAWLKEPDDGVFGLILENEFAADFTFIDY